MCFLVIVRLSSVLILRKYHGNSINSCAFYYLLFIYFTLIAFFGHISWQQKQEMQPLEVITALRFSM